MPKLPFVSHSVTLLGALLSVVVHALRSHTFTLPSLVVPAINRPSALNATAHSSPAFFLTAAISPEAFHIPSSKRQIFASPAKPTETATTELRETTTW